MNRFYIAFCVALFALSCTDPDSKSNNANNANNANNLNNTNNANNQTNNLNNQTNNLNNSNNQNNLADVCPAELPTGACATDTLVCEYGDDPRPGCRDRAECTGGNWLVSQSDCDVIPIAMCPATRQEADGQDCEPQDAYCSYAELDCLCTNCDDTGPVVMCVEFATWRCESPNPDTECPEGQLNYGAACETDGKICQYRCGPEGGMECKFGAWQPADGGPCPISTRSLKTDVRYLEHRDISEVSRALMELKLAQYRYTDDGLPAGEQLGIIIEDAPGSYAVDDKARMVDLYGFASMLLADAQEKERRIKSLEATVKRLEKKLQK